MTTIERHIEAPKLIENDVLPPSTGSISVERGGEQDFPPNVIPSENSALFVDVEEIAKSLDEGARKEFELQYSDFHSSFTFRFRGQLVEQLFRSYNDDDRADDSINLRAVAQMVQKELKTEQDRHDSQAFYLDNTAIPAARLRPEYSSDYKKATDYLQKDIAGLEDREDAHMAMSRYIEASKPKTEDELMEYTEQLVRQFLPEARSDVAKILDEQVAALEAQKKSIDEQIRKLAERKAQVTGLSQVEQTTPTEPEAERVGIIQQLTEKARSLAKAA